MFAAIVLILIWSGTLMLFDGWLRPARAISLCALRRACSAAPSYKPVRPAELLQNHGGAGAVLDAKAAASMISGYRHNNGLGAVGLDDHLMRMAEEQARAMASRTGSSTTLRGRSPSASSARATMPRLRSRTSGRLSHLAEAFSGWRDSPRTGPICCSSGVTKMGIAAAYSPDTKYKVFWALILAAPDDRRG